MNAAFIKANNKRAGLTLIEVLIALVILAIGVYAVLKIFPVGFGAIEATRQRTIAASLANAELERWKLLSGDMYTLPEAIVATDYSGALITDYDPAGLIPVQDDLLDPGQAVPAWQPDSLWLPRTIIGERFIIPPPVPDPPNPAEPPPLPFHALAFAPLDYYMTSPPAAADELIQVYDATPFQWVYGAPSTWEYNVNFTTGILTFNAVSYADMPFSVTYSWITTGGELRTVIGESGTTDGSGSLTVAAAGDAAFQQLAPMTERVYIRYQEYTGLGSPSSGQFKLDSTSLMTGVIYFAPENTGREVRINYRTADWAILRQDIEVPPGGNVKLALDGIKRAGYRNPPRDPLYEQLHPSLAVGVVVLALNLEDPDDPDHGVLENAESAGDGTMQVAYRTGEIMFSLDDNGDGDFEDTDDIDRAGMKYRVYYRAEGDWAVQVQKAAQSYGFGNTDAYLGFDRLSLYELQFDTCEIGKMVTLAYYRDIDVNKDGDYVDVEDIGRQFVSGELQMIQEDGTLTFCPELYDPADPDDPFPTRPSPDTGISVKGVSLTARTVWMGPGKSSVPEDLTFSGRPEYLNEAWRQSQVSTFLTTPLR